MPLEIIDGETRIDDVKALFSEYAASLGIDLGYQNYDEEFSGLPGKYARPDGRLYLALVDGVPAGCIAMRRLSASCAEMKRLYVRDDYRGQRIGRLLVERVIDSAREIGCDALVLDTLASMRRAQELYHSLGFVPTKAYYEGAYPGTVFLRLPLGNSILVPSDTVNPKNNETR